MLMIPTFSAAALSTLLDEANHAPQESVQSESVQSALQGVDEQPSPKIAWLVAHLTATKREYWRLIAVTTLCPAPPDDAGLTRLMTWEVETTKQLSEQVLDIVVTYDDQPFTVSELIRLNARRAIWYAGQIAALAQRSRVA